uniref:PLA2c domain-containing protein n=1 Tax=Pelodiscus sinensis TaxID=13735 RepID=K7FRN6_PELSI
LYLESGTSKLSKLHELSAGEKEATGTRKGKVLKCLQSQGVACDEKTMPNIAVLGSGGGLRAMIALLGTLVEMKKQRLLDAAMYLCGVSGSTWCMSTLYHEKDWAEKIEDLERRLRDQLSETSCDIIEEFNLVIQAAEDELFSLTDVWDAFFVYSVLKLHDWTKLSEQTDASKKGTNPYPIYAAIEYSKLSKEGKTNPGTWFEFTPHESGFPGLGAFVSTKALGSKFQGGTSTEQREERHIGYLQGLWGSAPGSMKENIRFLIGFFCEKSKISFLKCSEVHVAWSSKTWEERKAAFAELIMVFKTELQDAGAKNQMCLKQNVLVLSSTSFLLILRGKNKKKARRVHRFLPAFCLNWRSPSGRLPFALASPGFAWSVAKLLWKMAVCLCTWTWGSTHNFLYQSGVAQATCLTNKELIYLIDAGLAINSAYPLVLRSARNVKLILSFDFSSGDPFETIRSTSEYCQTNQIPFPLVDPQVIKDKDKPSGCYIFKGKDTPTVMHFPLFNMENCPANEIQLFRSKFATINMSYTKKDIEELLTKAKKNVSNNQEKILKEINEI